MRAVGSYLFGLALATLTLAHPAIARADPTAYPPGPQPSEPVAEETTTWEGGVVEAQSRCRLRSPPAWMWRTLNLSCMPADEEPPPPPPPPPPIDQEATDAMCAETERLLHDNPENLGKSEAELRAQLQARGCYPRVADKKSTSVALFAAYPYAAGTSGYILRRVPYWWTEPNASRVFSAQIAAEGSVAGRGVWGGGGHVRGSMWRMGVETSHFFHLDRPEKRGLYHGDLHFVFAPVLRSRAVLWIGMGAVWADQQFPLEERRERGLGISGTTSLDLFPFRPLVLSARIDAGKFSKESLAGSHTLRARVTAGLMLRRFELYGGYETKRIGQHSLHGPVLGLRTWF